MIGKIVNNRIIQPPVNDGNKFNVNLDSAWLEANGFRELTQEEIEAANNAAETEYQNSKCIERKKLDNYALGLIASINAKLPALNVLYTDSVDDVKVRAIDLGISSADVPELLTLKEVVGESRLPAASHNLEV